MRMESRNGNSLVLLSLLLASAYPGKARAFSPASIAIYSESRLDTGSHVRDDEGRVYLMGARWDSVAINRRAQSKTFVAARLRILNREIKGRSLAFASGSAVLDGKAFPLDSIRSLVLYRKPRFTRLEKRTLLAETLAVPLIFFALQWTARPWKGDIYYLPIILSVPMTFGLGAAMMGDLERTRILLRYRF